MKTTTTLILAAGCLQMAAAAPLDEAFRNPPPATQPRCYWYWMDGHITQDGITRDLEAMKRVGIGSGYIGVISGQSGMQPNPKPMALTDAWWENIEHAIREGGRLGVDVGLFNSPGWSQSGGPWVKPSQAMRYVVLPETRLRGPQAFAGKLPVPDGPFQDVAVLAFPAPAGDDVAAAITSRTPTRIQFDMPAPFAARSVTVRPAKAINVTADLQASDDGRTYRSIARFPINRSNLKEHVGPVPLAPVVAAFPLTTAKSWRLDLSAAGDLAEVKLSPAARIASYAEKSLLKVFQQPLPPFDFYTWPTPPDPDSDHGAVPPASVLNLTQQLAPDGTLRWNVPPGEWIVARAAMIPTGTKNAPAPAEATGLEVDKMNRAPLAAHFDAFIGEVLRRMPAGERKALKHVVADSYEMGPQTWTDGFADIFRRRYGYDPLPWLPAMGGRVVGSPERSDRFLWDLRRLVADRVASEYVGGLRDLCERHGLRMWLENYGHWGFPAEFLQYGGGCHEIGGEFWVDGDLGGVELRAAASAAHTYGKPVVWAEAFTGGPAFRSTPASLKARGDWALCEGINQFVLHVYIHQPWEDQKPGINAWFGTEFNRHNTWFEQGKAWIDYLRRCTVMLQTGQPVADVAYFITEDAPKMTGIQDPPLPPGRDFDYINAEVIERDLQVKDGLLTLPHGVSYRVLALPKSATMRPAVLKRLRQWVGAGATVLGHPPSRSPSLENFPACDDEVRQLARELWGEAATTSPAGEHACGSGRVFWGKSLDEVLAALGSTRDFESSTRLRFKHRRAGDHHLYFVANPANSSVTTTATFRVAGKLPELWWPHSGQIQRPATFESADGRTTLPLQLGPAGSVFVVFRENSAGFQPVKVASPPLRIVVEKASYGPPNEPARTRDARPDVQLLVDKGLNSFVVGRLAEEGHDPAFGVVKTLTVAYSLDGQKFTASGQDPQTITLGSAIPAAQVHRHDRGIVLEAWRQGSYQLVSSSGEHWRAEVPRLPEPWSLAGAWEVDFPLEPAVKATFEKLENWAVRPEGGIRGFSGRAVYRKAFDLPAGMAAVAGQRLTLDLGAVHDLATVRLNGVELATLWIAPWEVDITGAARAGRNTLEVEVCNTWNNRLAADAALAGKRRTFLSSNTVGAGTAVQPAGLLGPVTLRASRSVAVK